MKDFNKYILEKLKINKDTIISGFANGNIILCVALKNKQSNGIIYLELNIYPFEFIEFKHGKICYYGYNDSKIYHKVKENSKGYYEYYGGENTDYRRCVFLDKETGIKFMNYLKNEFDTKPSKIYKYFDNSNDLEDFILDVDNSKKEIQKVIDKLNGKIPITEKLHIDKDTKLFDKASNIIQDLFDKGEIDFGKGIKMDIKYETNSSRDIIKIIPSKEVELRKMHEISDLIKFELEINNNMRIIGAMVNKEEIRYIFC